MKVTICITLGARFGLRRCLSAHAVTKFHNDACCEPLPYPWSLRDQRLVTVDECAAKKIRSVRREQGDRHLWADTAHVEQGGEEACLITCRKSNKGFAVFTDDVVQIQLKGRPFGSGAQHCWM